MTTPFQNHIALVTGANDPEGLGFGIARELIAWAVGESPYRFDPLITCGIPLRD